MLIKQNYMSVADSLEFIANPKPVVCVVIFRRYIRMQLSTRTARIGVDAASRDRVPIECVDAIACTKGSGLLI